MRTLGPSAPGFAGTPSGGDRSRRSSGSRRPIRYAEAERGLNDDPVAIARACEEVLLSSGLVDEAYARYGLVANQAGTHLAWFRAIAKKYPHKPAADVLADLVAHTPGEEGKWFAAHLQHMGGGRG